jgi:hypothetical protein
VRIEAVKKVLSELGNWRDYAPAAIWAFLALAVTVAGPIWAALS